MDDDWTSPEDAQLRRSIVAGESWSDIADALLRSIASVQARAVYLDRLARATEYATTGPGRLRTKEELKQLVTEHEAFIDQTRRTPQQELARLTEEAKARRVVHPTMPKEERVPAVLEATSRVRAEPAPQPPTPVKELAFDAGPRILVRTCVRCEKHFTSDDLWLDHPGGAEHFDCCAHTIKRPAPETYIHAKPEKRRVRVLNGGCSGRSGETTCCLRTRHRGEHLSDTGIIFSRDGKDQWRDVGDVYLLMCLNNDMVAPQP